MTDKQIHWLGEVAQGFISFGFAFLAYRLTKGMAAMRPLVNLPLGVRVGLALLFVLLFATFRAHWHYRRMQVPPTV